MAWGSVSAPWHVRSLGPTYDLADGFEKDVNVPSCEAVLLAVAGVCAALGEERHPSIVDGPAMGCDVAGPA